MFKPIVGYVNLGLVLLCLCGFTLVATQVETPPQVTWRSGSQERIIVMEGKTANYMINCTATGVPSPTFEWRKDDQVVSDSQYIQTFKNGSLYFPNFSDREIGLYQCIAKNSLGTSLSVKVPIVKEKVPGTADDSSGVNKVVTQIILEGNPANLQCIETPATVPEYVRRWYREQGTAEVELNERIGTDAQGTMRFSYVEPSDASSYVCALAPRVAHEQSTIKIYNNVKLEVKENRKESTNPILEFRSGNGNVKAILNRTATLECFFSGYPVAKVSWKSSSNYDITASNARFKLEDYNRRLIINEVRLEDEGVFSCTGNNGHGEVIGLITVNVTSPPYKVPNQGLIGMIQPDHTRVTLLCQAKAAIGESLNPPIWYRNGELLKLENLPDPARYSFSTDNTQLTITDTSKTVDTACFQCNVTNSEGYAFYDGFLRVINSIVISKRPGAVNVIADKETIDISVLASGDACCQIDKRWYFNNNTLTKEDMETPPLVWDANTETLMFNTTNVADGIVTSRLGKYSVRVSNTYQNVTVEFTIVRKGADTIVAADAGFQIWWIAIIIAVLVIIIIILIVVCCVKRNYPGETYQLEKTELQHNLNPKEELLDQSFQEI